MYRTKRPNKPLRIITNIDDLPVLCDAAEVGLLLRVTPEKICRMAAEGKLKGAKPGQSWLFRRDDIVTYMNKLFEQV